MADTCQIRPHPLLPECDHGEVCFQGAEKYQIKRKNVRPGRSLAPGESNGLVWVGRGRRCIRGHKLLHCSPYPLGQAKGRGLIQVFFLDLLRRHLSIQSGLSEPDVRGRQQSPNYSPDFLSCIHFLPALPLSPTNLPQTHMSSHCRKALNSSEHSPPHLPSQLRPLLQG